MNNNPFLRAVDQLFSDGTLIVFVVVVTFLALRHWISNKAAKWSPNQWVATYLGAFCSYLILIAAYIVINILGYLMQKLRFGSTTDLTLSTRFWMTLILAFFIPFLYMVVYSLKEFFRREIGSGSTRVIAEAIAILVILYLPMITAQAIFNGTIDHRLLHSMAKWVPMPFGTVLAVFFYNYYTYLNGFKVQENELQIAMLKQQVTQSQLDALSSKINPHFLYNSLNSVAAFATVDSAKTRGMAIALSKLFKYSLNNEEKNYARISDEMDMVALYLDVEKIRFEEKLRYVSTVQEGISDCLIPRNLLQPLVENAIKHGSGTDGVEINISIEKGIKRGVVIRVKDSGTAFTALNPGYGLRSIYDKLDILMPGNYEIVFFNEPKMVQIELFDAKLRHI